MEYSYILLCCEHQPSILNSKTYLKITLRKFNYLLQLLFCVDCATLLALSLLLHAHLVLDSEIPHCCLYMKEKILFSLAPHTVLSFASQTVAMTRTDQSLTPRSWLKGKEEQTGLENGQTKGIKWQTWSNSRINVAGSIHKRELQKQGQIIPPGAQWKDKGWSRKGWTKTAIRKTPAETRGKNLCYKGACEPLSEQAARWLKFSPWRFSRADEIRGNVILVWG